jgi:hypothetical protein
MIRPDVSCGYVLCKDASDSENAMDLPLGGVAAVGRESRSEEKGV